MASDLLVIDAGNTSLKVGVFSSGTLALVRHLDTVPKRTVQGYVTAVGKALNGFTPRSAAICSVVPDLTPILGAVCESICASKPLYVSARTKSDLKPAYNRPASMGSDRIAGVAGALAVLGRPPFIVVNHGTCLVLDAVNAQYEHIGGAIVPSMRSAAGALMRDTAALPKVDLFMPDEVIGRDTVHAICAGIGYGYGALLDGLLTRFKCELASRDDSECKVVATGGAIDQLRVGTTAIDVVESDLIFLGLQRLYALNCQ